MIETSFSGPILCPVDFSELSASALRLAAVIGNRCSRAVTALHAHWFEVPPYLTPGQNEQIEAQLHQALEEAGSALQRFVNETVEDRAPAVRIEEGDPREVILRVAKAGGSGLIVMGTHGRTGIRRLALGSVAEQVLHSSSIPVLTIRQAARAGAISKIVCAVNDSDVSRTALMHAASLAQCLGAHLTVMHVLEGDNRRVIPDLCAWIADRKRPECEIRNVTRKGHPTEEILRLVEEQQAELLVIGAERRLFLDRTVVGTTTAQLVRHAPSAVLTVPGGAIEDTRSGQIEHAA